MLTCFLDDSGESAEPIITCAGYLSLADQWQHFERIARECFDEAGIEYLHAVDLYHRRCPFHEMNSTETLEFARAFFSLVKPFVAMGFEFSVLKSQFQAMKKAYGLKREGSPFAFCFKGIVDRLIKNDGVLYALQQPGVDLSFVVETGHKNNEEVRQIFNRYKMRDPQRLGSLIFEDKKRRIALQAADFLAFFSRRIRNIGKKDDLKYFQTATQGITHHYFLATNFGV